MEREDKIRNMVQERAIKLLVHFTPDCNLKTIVENGLLSRRVLSQRRIPFRFTDDKMLSRHPWHCDYVSVSIAFPNYKMFYKVRHSYEFRDTCFVVLGISPEVLWKCECLFFAANAASLRYVVVSRNRLRTPEEFAAMFSCNGRSPLIPQDYPTDPQAEVLVLNQIERHFITQIFVANDQHAGQVRGMFQGYAIPVRVASELFGPRKDYEQWKSNRRWW